MTLPRMMRVRQNFDGQFIDDILTSVENCFQNMWVGYPNCDPMPDIRGKTVAITAGSRGIDRVNLLIKAVVDALELRGAKPFIVPAMGSHGGGTAEGQLAVLKSLGVTEEFCCAPIKATMDVVKLGETEAEKMPVWLDNNAYQADYIFVVNRVKPHTIFSGRHGSGLLKMLAVGLGKLVGARTIHSFTKRFQFDDVAESVLNVYRASGKLLGGLAVAENAFDKIRFMRACRPEEFWEVDFEMHTVAREFLLPRIPYPEIDLLIVDEMGKDISGTGMDPNVVMRMKTEHWLQKAPGSKEGVRLIYVRDLTEKTHGNAAGIGYADACTERLVSKIDKASTYTNVLTSGMLSKGAIPVSFKTDKEAIDALVAALPDPANPVIVRIRNTADLAEFSISKNIVHALPEACSVVGEHDIEFDEEGNLK